MSFFFVLFFVQLITGKDFFQNKDVLHFHLLFLESGTTMVEGTSDGSSLSHGAQASTQGDAASWLQWWSLLL